MTKVLPQTSEQIQPPQEPALQPLADLDQSQKLAPARALATWFCKKYLILAILPIIVQALVFSLPNLMNGHAFSASDAYGTLYLGELFLFPLGLLFGLILVHKLFSFQHQAQGGNLVYALPLTRARLYLTLLASLAILLAIPRLASLLQNSLLFLLDGVSFVYLLRMELAIYLKIWAALALLIFFYTEGFNSFNAQLLAIFTNIFWPLLFFALQFIGQACLPSFAGFDWSQPLPLLFAPYVSGFQPGLWQGWTLGIRLLTSLAFLLLSYFAFLNRPAEKMARYDIEAPAFILPRAIISVASGLCLALVLYYIRGEFTQDAPGWLIFIFGLILGSLLANLLQDLLYSRGVLKLCRALTKALALTIPGLVIVALLASGLFGYDYLLPQPGDQTKISLARVEAGIPQYTPWAIFGVYQAGYPDQLAADQYLPHSWQLDDPDQKAFFTQLLDQAYQEGQPGLELPRDLTSYNRYRGLSGPDTDTVLSKDGLLDISLSWQNPGSPFRHKRILPLTKQSLETLAPLFTDPAMAAFFYRLAYEDIVQIYLIQDGARVKPGPVTSEAKASGEEASQQSLGSSQTWLQLWQTYVQYEQEARDRQAYIPSFHLYSERFIDALMADYSKLDRAEREALAQEGKLQISLRFSGRLTQELSSGPMALNTSILAGQDTTEKLKLPVKENFNFSKQVFVDMLHDQDLYLEKSRETH